MAGKQEVAAASRTVNQNSHKVWNRVEVKSISCYEKENMQISKVVQLFIGKKMVEEHCSVHSIKICKGSRCIAPLSLSFGIKGRRVLNITNYHFTPR
jgi:hypothetical protein